MDDSKKYKKSILGNYLTLDSFMDIVRQKKPVELSNEYISRVNNSRSLVDKWIEQDKVMYGITTGFGVNSTKTISQNDVIKLQENILITHATSVGQLMTEEEVRAIMLMILQNAGMGYSGIRIETLDRYKEFLNKNIIPYVPKEGSVGYLSPEAHIALSVIGKGKVIKNGQVISCERVFKQNNLDKYKLSYKEGLILISGTTSVTGLAAIALFDIIKAVKIADIIGAMTLEVSKGTLRAFDERLMKVRPHKQQYDTAKNIRKILEDSEIAKKYYNYRLQDALSIRCIPQLHGASKKTLYDALRTLEIEMNSCTDNPIIWRHGEDGEAISGGNPDSAYIGIEMDSVCIAATMVAKMSERRNNRLIDGNLSENPWFLVDNPGLNSGLMIPQYTQAGLLNDMKILSTSSVIDNIPTCGNQEDYVAMGYNASKKALAIAEKLEYILAIELLSAYQSYRYLDNNLRKSVVTQAIIDEISKTVPIMEDDIYLYPHIEKLRSLIHDGVILNIAEKVVGEIL
ncbi:aromatic amino acid ammonia-lyase [Schnuerera sp. xch1]|uniref:HAL/PAL/TAL family ammonia-lyase n=1 Tax=Schnuerera sp. xch1 TaxID=2874283 RepID=UPI001CBDDCE9|nr:aromatic amino acid ammonia-lyase [Schnuerera sp. xch1]MBZ2175174.1 aromatic amino acid ammonia-lyase [Schnuerera sp. xch1]